MSALPGHGSRRRRLIAASVVALLLVAGSAIAGGLVSRSDRASASAPPVAPVITTTTMPTTTTAKPTTTTTVPLPWPTSPPADPYADVPVNQIGTMEVPKIGLVHPVFEGIWLTVIDHGPGHWPGTAMPGQLGNAVFAGHRVTHTHPFLNLDLLAAGDHVIFDMPDGVYTYAVTSITIVQPDDLAIAYPTRARTMTLFACNPKHSAAQRIVVKGRLISSERVGAPSAASAPLAPSAP